MEPKITLDSITFDQFEDTITLSSTDHLSLSGYEYSNAVVGGGYVSPGYGAVPNASISAISYPYTITGSNTATGIASPWYSNSTSPKIKLDGKGADIEVNGWSLIDAIQKIEQRLNILNPNEELEAEWEELRSLGNQYRQLEQHIKDKQATWDRLKAMPAPEID